MHGKNGREKTEIDKVNPLLLVAIIGIVILETALILTGEDGEYLALVVAAISYLAGVKTPDFLKTEK